jgi:hypothetical protein
MPFTPPIWNTPPAQPNSRATALQVTRATSPTTRSNRFLAMPARDSYIVFSAQRWLLVKCKVSSLLTNHGMAFRSLSRALF